MRTGMKSAMSLALALTAAGKVHDSQRYISGGIMGYSLSNRMSWALACTGSTVLNDVKLTSEWTFFTTRRSLAGRHPDPGGQSVVAWHTGSFAAVHLFRPPSVSHHTCKTMLKSSLSLTESMTDALAEAIGVEPNRERFKVGGVRRAALAEFWSFASSSHIDTTLALMNWVDGFGIASLWRIHLEGNLLRQHHRERKENMNMNS